MSNAPYVMEKVRQGLRMGHSSIKDHMFIDGLEDAYDKGKLMGSFAEDTAEAYQFTRDEQDNFAITSLERAKKANKDLENSSDNSLDNQEDLIKKLTELKELHEKKILSDEEFAKAKKKILGE